MVRQTLSVGAVLCLLGGTSGAQTVAPQRFVNPTNVTQIPGNPAANQLLGQLGVNRSTVGGSGTLVGGGFNNGLYAVGGGYYNGGNVYYPGNTAGLYTGSYFGWGGGPVTGYPVAQSPYPGGVVGNGYGNGNSAGSPNGLPVSKGGVVGTGKVEEGASAVLNGAPGSGYRPQRKAVAPRKKKSKSTRSR